MSERPPTNGGEARPTQRQVVKFTFFKVDPSWRRLPPAERARARDELCAVVEAFGDRMLIRSYSLSGLRGDADFLLWQIADELEAFQAFSTQLFSTAMGPYLTVPHSFLSMTRRSIYRTPKELEAGGASADARLRVMPGEAAYLFVYPFVKTRSWYELPKEERQAMMDEHIGIGRRYPSVKLNTTYSYGIDDQEFVVSFETDNASDFLDLVMELRETKASMYTLRDTPTFTCVRLPLPDVLLAVGAPGDVALAGAASPGGGEWTPVVTLAELPPGSAKAVYLAGEQVALFNVDGQVYALGNRCSHANGPLADGTVAEGCVTCPYHESRFDLRTGLPVGGPAQQPVPAYRVKVEDGAVLLAPREVEAPSLP